jgi:AraC-like DNA-binding protein
MGITFTRGAPEPRPGGIRVLYANQLVIDQRWVFRLCDPFWRLYFNRDAGAWVADGRRRWELPPYRAVLIPAWGDVRGRCVGHVRHFYLHFETPGLPAEWIRRVCREPLALPDDAVLRAMLDTLATETTPAYPIAAPGGGWRLPERSAADASATWRLRAEAAAAWALARALEQVDPGAVAELGGRRGDADVDPALLEIDAHLAEPLTVARLARRCGLGPDRFARRFAAATGRTPMRYLQERRVAAAADRLVSGDVPIETLSREAGFANRFHFTRVFTRLIGTPPAAYRRQHRR